MNNPKRKTELTSSEIACVERALKAYAKSEKDAAPFTAEQAARLGQRFSTAVEAEVTFLDTGV